MRIEAPWDTALLVNPARQPRRLDAAIHLILFLNQVVYLRHQDQRSVRLGIKS